MIMHMGEQWEMAQVLGTSATHVGSPDGVPSSSLWLGSRVYGHWEREPADEKFLCVSL